MKTRQSGQSQATAAAKSGMSERTARAIETGRRGDPRQCARRRPPRLGALWQLFQSECIPMLEALPQLQPITLLEYLQDKYTTAEGAPVYPDRVLRTLQRYVKAWKAEHGPTKDVIFRQQQVPGRLGLSDFTHPKEFDITIAGEPFTHLLYHFRLAYSHWSHLKVILGGESFTALSEGLQEALWRLGGAPKEHRTDSLSAAFKNLEQEAARDGCEGYKLLCEHYGMTPTRNNLGVSHENGSIESPHGHLKRRIKQALLLRGSRDFISVAAYQAWLDQVVNQHNRRYAQALTVERPELQPLPVAKTLDYTQIVAKVSSASTIDVRRVTYTVPSPLIGETLRLRLYHDRLLCYLGCRQVYEVARVYPPKGTMTRGRQIDYRHVIHALAKKPQAFRYYQHRQALLPTDAYRRIWQQVDERLEAREACRFMVGLLQLAATASCEQPLGEAVLLTLSKEQPLRLCEFQAQFAKTRSMPEVTINQPSLRSYDVAMATASKEVCHV